MALLDAARAMHWDRATLEERERMGFREGWGQCVDQIEALARSLASAGGGPAPSAPGPALAPRVSTCLWFDDQALPAAEFYCAIVPGSRIDRIHHTPEVPGMGEPGSVLVVDFTLAGTPCMALNGGPRFTLDEAVSVAVSTEDQDETDRRWEALVEGGGTESRGGWLKDRFGRSWQIIPKRAVELLNGPNAARIWPTLLRMRKIDVAALEAAAGLETPSGRLTRQEVS